MRYVLSNRELYGFPFPSQACIEIKAIFLAEKHIASDRNKGIVDSPTP